VDSRGQPGSPDTAACTARLAADSTVRALVSAVPAAAELVGTRASSGFRRHLASLGGSLESLDMALLDELPTLSIVSGYARGMESGSRPVRIPALLNACTGWAEGGTADRGSRATGHFRDSDVDRDGAEFSLHEYVVRATAAEDGLVLRTLDVDARALPYPGRPAHCWLKDGRHKLTAWRDPWGPASALPTTGWLHCDCGR
jgi:hypothetical protein